MHVTSPLINSKYRVQERIIPESHDLVNSVLYKAVDESDNVVVIKTLQEWQKKTSTVREWRSNFIWEAFVLSELLKLNHPNILKYVDFLLDENLIPYIVTEYWVGKPLSTICRCVSGTDNSDKEQIGNSNVNNEEDALEYISQVASALIAMHDNGWVHLDVSPNNILVAEPIDRNSDKPKALLIDFGISERVSEAPSETLRSFLTFEKEQGFPVSSLLFDLKVFPTQTELIEEKVNLLSPVELRVYDLIRIKQSEIIDDLTANKLWLSSHKFTPSFSSYERTVSQSKCIIDDIYSLSATSYYLLTGEIPKTSLERKRLGHCLAPLNEACPCISDISNTVIMQGLDLNPEKRIYSAKTFLWRIKGQEFWNLGNINDDHELFRIVAVASLSIFSVTVIFASIFYVAIGNGETDILIPYAETSLVLSSLILTIPKISYELKKGSVLVESDQANSSTQEPNPIYSLIYLLCGLCVLGILIKEASNFIRSIFVHVLSPLLNLFSIGISDTSELIHRMEESSLLVSVISVLLFSAMADIIDRRFYSQTGIISKKKEIFNSVTEEESAADFDSKIERQLIVKLLLFAFFSIILGFFGFWIGTKTILLHS